MIWSKSKRSLLRQIKRTNDAGAVFFVTSFNGRDIDLFALEGYVTCGLRGPFVTTQGDRQLRAFEREAA